MKPSELSRSGAPSTPQGSDRSEESKSDNRLEPSSSQKIEVVNFCACVHCGHAQPPLPCACGQLACPGCNVHVDFRRELPLGELLELAKHVIIRLRVRRERYEGKRRQWVARSIWRETPATQTTYLGG